MIAAWAIKYLWVIRRIVLDNPIHFRYIQTSRCDVSAEKYPRVRCAEFKECTCAFLLFLLSLGEKNETLSIMDQIHTTISQVFRQDVTGQFLNSLSSYLCPESLRHGPAREKYILTSGSPQITNMPLPGLEPESSPTKDKCTMGHATSNQLEQPAYLYILCSPHNCCQ